MHEELCKRIKDNVHFIAKKLLIYMDSYVSVSQFVKVLLTYYLSCKVCKNDQI